MIQSTNHTFFVVETFLRLTYASSPTVSPSLPLHLSLSISPSHSLPLTLSPLTLSPLTLSLLLFLSLSSLSLSLLSLYLLSLSVPAFTLHKLFSHIIEIPAPARRANWNAW